MTDVDLDEYAGVGQCAYVQCADLIEGQPFLMPSWITEEESTALNTGLNGKIGNVRGYALAYAAGARMCAVDYGLDTTPNPDENRMGLFTKDSPSVASWMEADSDSTASGSSATEPCGGAWAVGGVVYFFSNYSNNLCIGSCNAFTSPTLALNTYTLAWSGSSYVRGFIQHTDGETYVFTNHAIGLFSVEATALATFPATYDPVDAISYGNKVLIAANSTNGETSKLFIWDPYQSLVYTYDDVYDTKVFRICAIRNVAGRVIIITADFDYKIWQWTGGDNLILLKTLKVGDYNTDFTVKPWAVDVKDGILYFGTYCAVAGFKNGIYAFGFNNDGSTFLYNAFLSLSAASPLTYDSSLQYFKAIKWYDDKNAYGSSLGEIGLFATAYDATNGAYRNLEFTIGSARSAGSATLAENGCVYESVWMRPFPGLKSQILKATLFHEAFGANTTIRISHKKDGDSGYTAIATCKGNTEFKTIIGNNGFLTGGASGTFSNAFTKGHKHKIKIDLMTADAQLEKIKLRFRTAEQD